MRRRELRSRADGAEPLSGRAARKPVPEAEARPALLATVVAFLATVAAAPAPAAAQQFATDDAVVVEPGGCQIEAWVGQPATWLLPACTAGGLEVTAGLGAVPDEDGSRASEWVLQGKWVSGAPGPGEPSWGLVAGVGMDRFGQVRGGKLASAYAYVPTTVVAAERFVLHGNLGWVYEPADDGEELDGGEHGLLWAARIDVPFTDRATAIGELLGDSRMRPVFQTGLHFTVLPDLLFLDASYLHRLERGEGDDGFTLGVAWTPEPFF